MKPNSRAKEQSLNPTANRHSRPKRVPNAAEAEEIDERILTALDAASDKKAIQCKHEKREDSQTDQLRIPAPRHRFSGSG